MELLHFTGQVWRPPYEASSQLLQVTAGCTHNKCKFCSLYHGTKFRLSPITEVEEDLKVIQKYQPRARRVFLTGANPFASPSVHYQLRVINCISRIKTISGNTKWGICGSNRT